MPNLLDPSATPQGTPGQTASRTLLALERQLEQIRQELLAKNRSRLCTLSARQREHVEIVTLAIIRKLLAEVAQQWDLYSAQGKEARVREVVLRMWSLDGESSPFAAVPPARRGNSRP